MHTAFGSLITAAVTPFDTAGQVNHEELRRLLRHLVESGSEGVVINGTTGEAPTLSDEEQLACLRTAIDEIGGQATVIAGTGSNDTAHAVRRTAVACEAGADGVLVVTPYYNRPPREGLRRHFTAVARAASAPMMLYNVPSRTGTLIEADLVAELAELDTVVAIKQAHPDLQQLQAIRSLAPELAVYAGDDVSLMPMLPHGVLGVVSVASHIVGPAMARVIEYWRDGRHEEARAASRALDDVYETLAIGSNPIPIKAALELLGFSVGSPRLPLVPAGRMQRERIRAMLERSGLVAAHV